MRRALGVSEGKLPPAYPSLPSQGGGLPAQDKARLAGRSVHDFDVVELEGAEPDTERFHHRLLGGEARRESLGRIAPTGTGGPLTVSEHPPHHAGGARDHPPEPVDLDSVDADSPQGCALQ